MGRRAEDPHVEFEGFRALVLVPVVVVDTRVELTHGNAGFVENPGQKRGAGLVHSEYDEDHWGRGSRGGSSHGQ